MEFGAGRARAATAYVIESAPGHPGLMALALPWEGADAHAELHGAGPPLRAADRGDARRRRGPDAPDGPAASGSTTASTTAAWRRCATRSSRWPASRGPPAPREILAAARRPLVRARTARHRGEAAAFAAFERALRTLDFAAQSRHGRSRPTRWARSGWARPARPSRATRAAGSVHARGSVDRRACTWRRLALPDRPRGQPDGHHHGAGAAGHPDGRRRGRRGRLSVPAARSAAVSADRVRLRRSGSGGQAAAVRQRRSGSGGIRGGRVVQRGRRRGAWHPAPGRR